MDQSFWRPSGVGINIGRCELVPTLRAIKLIRSSVWWSSQQTGPLQVRSSTYRHSERQEMSLVGALGAWSCVLMASWDLLSSGPVCWWWCQLTGRRRRRRRRDTALSVQQTLRQAGQEISQIIEVQSTMGRLGLQQQPLRRKTGGSCSDLTSHHLYNIACLLTWQGKIMLSKYEYSGEF